MWWVFAAAEAGQAEFLRPAFMAYLRARGTDDSDFDNAELIFGELVSNVVRHAPGPIAVTVWWKGGYPILVVADRGPGFQLRSCLPEDTLAEYGRGLFLVSVFGHALAVEDNPSGGMRVSVRLPVRRRSDRSARYDEPFEPLDVLAVAASTFADLPT